MATTTSTNYVPQSPVLVVSPSGRSRAFGVGASTDSARGTALAAAFAAHSAGDTIIVHSATYAMGSASLTALAGDKIIGVGKPRLTSATLTNPQFIVAANDVVIDNFYLENNTAGVGVYSDTPITATGVEISRITFRPADATHTHGIFWGNAAGQGAGAAEHTVTASIRHCDLEGGSSSGYGILASLSASGSIEVDQSSGFGTTDGILLGGASGSTGVVRGGSWSSTLDAITAGLGTRIDCYALKARGDQADLFGDDGTVVAHACDVRPEFCAGTVKVSEHGTELSISESPTVGISLNRSASASAARDVLGASSGVFPVSAGGTGASTAAAARAALGLNTRSAQLLCVPAGTTLTTGDGKGGIFFRVPSAINGWNLTGVAANVTVASSSGTPTIQVRRVRAGSPADMLSTRITIDANELDSKDAATPAVINASNDDVATGDQIYIDCDVAGTSTEGLSVLLTFTEV